MNATSFVRSSLSSGTSTGAANALPRICGLVKVAVQNRSVSLTSSAFQRTA